VQPPLIPGCAVNQAPTTKPCMMQGFFIDNI